MSKHSLLLAFKSNYAINICKSVTYLGYLCYPCGLTKCYLCEFPTKIEEPDRNSDSDTDSGSHGSRDNLIYRAKQRPLRVRVRVRVRVPILDHGVKLNLESRAVYTPPKKKGEGN